ncbi:MAG TPA: hypothetical protein VFF73_26820 [Planctomycetota bacterium]|nr:hypothetical protein [Planctomycetota bacterium]
MESTNRGALLLTLRGRFPWPQPEIAFGCTVLFGAPVLVFGLGLVLDPSRIAGVPTRVRVVLGTSAIAAGFFKWCHARMRRSSWYADVYENGVELKTSPAARPRVWAPWGDVAWFDDSEHENVKLKLEGPVSSLIDIQLPTSTEADRTALLAILAVKTKRRGE